MRGPAPFNAPRFSGFDLLQSQNTVQAFMAQWVPVRPDRRALQEESRRSIVGDQVQSDPATSGLPLYGGNEPAPLQLVTDPESLARETELINLPRQENVAMVSKL